jgi:beta-N-acetylhexosaminidase
VARRPLRPRQRLALLAAAALLAALAGALVGARAGGDEPPTPAGSPAPAPARSAGSERDRAELLAQVGGLVVLRFRGATLPAYVREALRERRAAGVVLFGDNVTGPAQLRALTAGIQRAARGRALVLTDQEGGAVRTLPWAAPSLPAPARGSEQEAQAQALAAARDLRAHGVNVALAPVADVAVGPGSVMAGRALPGDAGRVAALVRASLRGFAAGGVAATVKHFPGLGAASANTDDTAVTVPAPAVELEARDLPPFAAAVEAGVPLVMASHALYPALDGERIASQSPAILRGLLRERLGFHGVVVTDSLEAQAVVRRSSTPTAAARSLAAGADLLLTTGPGSYLDVVRRLLADARRSPALRERVREATGRVEALRDRLARAPR